MRKRKPPPPRDVRATEQGEADAVDIAAEAALAAAAEVLPRVVGVLVVLYLVEPDDCSLATTASISTRDGETGGTRVGPPPAGVMLEVARDTLDRVAREHALTGARKMLQ